MKQNSLIEVYGLESWWRTKFTEDERQRIREVYASNTGGDVIDKDPLALEVGGLSLSPRNVDVTEILRIITQWFQRNTDIEIWIKLSESWHELASQDESPINRHFALIDTMNAYYRKRDEPEYLSKTVDVCNLMISMEEEVAKAMFKAGLGRVSPELAQKFGDRVVHTELGPQTLPSHPGFKQLTIIYEKRKDLQKALDICVRAQESGWAGDWDKRIVRLQKKLSK